MNKQFSRSSQYNALIKKYVIYSLIYFFKGGLLIKNKEMIFG